MDLTGWGAIRCHKIYLNKSGDPIQPMRFHLGLDVLQEKVFEGNKPGIHKASSILCNDIKLYVYSENCRFLEKWEGQI